MFRLAVLKRQCLSKPCHLALKPTAYSLSRNFTTSYIIQNKEIKKDDSKIPDSTSKSSTPSNSEEVNTSGFDFNKPRKPLSRVAIGTKIEKDTVIERRDPLSEMLSWKAGVLFLLVGFGLTLYFNKEKKRLALAKEEEENRGYGKVLVGGPFKLIDHDGNEFTEKKLLGKFSLLYFGFTRCPDICPDELDKMTIIIDNLKKAGIENFQPIFVTCDPARDPPQAVKDYLSEFHPDIIGLTGTYEGIKHMCKKYRVYFSTPKDIKPGQDYLVDHSIFFYLMDPDGEFIDVLGRQYEADTATEKIKEHIQNFVPKEEREKKKNKTGIFGFFG